MTWAHPTYSASILVTLPMVGDPNGSFFQGYGCILHSQDMLDSTVVLEFHSFSSFQVTSLPWPIIPKHLTSSSSFKVSSYLASSRGPSLISKQGQPMCSYNALCLSLSLLFGGCTFFLEWFSCELYGKGMVSFLSSEYPAPNITTSTYWSCV